uniref:Ground-like domain-containing protein n=1 Tax=Plectus sambesii TaxID=2011161 RepID=A0A914XQI8_9BILA
MTSSLLIVFALAATVIIVADGCGFGSGGSSGGCGGPPAPATCAAPAPPPVSNCGGCGGSSGGSCGGSSGGGCGGCRTLRRYYHRRHVRDASSDNKTVINQYIDSVRVKQSEHDDPACNSKELKAIIEENISTDPAASKEAIHRAAVDKFSGFYAVVCSTVGFTFKADSHHYCLHSNDNMHCYVFQTAKAAKE